MRIQFDKEVTFRDEEGGVTRVYPIGAIIEASAINEVNGAFYFVTSMGGIWEDEAHKVKE